MTGTRFREIALCATFVAGQPVVDAAVSRAADDAAYTVTLDAFSGRGNPSFSLSGPDLDQFLRMLSKLCGTDSVPAEQKYPSKFLGYQGTLVTQSRRGSDRQGQPSVRLSRGTARIYADNPPPPCGQAGRGAADRDVVDAGQAVEKYLVDLAHAKKVINDAEYKAILKGMKGTW